MCVPAVQAPVVGSYNSALAGALLARLLLVPPTTSTCPLGSRVAVCRNRGILIGPVAVKEAALASGVEDKLTDRAASAVRVSTNRVVIWGRVFIRLMEVMIVVVMRYEVPGSNSL